MNEQYLRGVLGFKGERGYSAYEIAVQNGYIGTERDWLAQLGTSSHFMKDSVVYMSAAEQTVFALPETYTTNSCVDVYIEGFRLAPSKYEVDAIAKTVTIKNMTLDEGEEVEVVVLRMTSR